MVNGNPSSESVGHGHSAMEPGKVISMSKFHQVTGHTGE